MQATTAPLDTAARGAPVRGVLASVLAGAVPVVDGVELAPAAVAQVVDRLSSGHWNRFTDQQAGCGYCAKPVRLRGTASTIDTRTGEVLSRYDTDREPDGVTYLRCSNRRAAVCPSCSREYKGDMWHLLAAGAGGGMKGVPASVGSHPQLFVTVTAPSFGQVHTARAGNRPCHPPRKGRAWVCRHGRPTWCAHRHDECDGRLGQPLCPDCYDYPSQVIWQWLSTELWRRFTIALYRELATSLGISRSRIRDHAQWSHAKVTEFQRRGVIHFHAILRLDGPATAADPYPAPQIDLGMAELQQVIATAAAKTTRHVPPATPGDVSRRLRFGAQVDIRPVRASAADDGDAELSPRRVAAYIAKYATKACEDFGIPPGITGPEAARRQGVNDHACRIIETAAHLAADADAAGVPTYDGLGRWLHMLGYHGHFATKSRRYSVTLDRLRTERRRWRIAQLQRPSHGPLDELEADLDPDAEETTLVIGSWTFAGIGWRTASDAALAAESAALAREYADRKRQQQRSDRSVSSFR